MIGTVLKAVAYSRAPRTTFSVLHPKKAAVLGKMKWDLRHAPAPRLTAVGAAALMLPLGVLLGWIGRNNGPRRNPVRRPFPDTSEPVMETDVDLDEDELL
ncbi:MAG TPA: hypothetical protein VMN60_01005 [Longimicrobiales bacterium]|nr:hypothetical protein [Longimicrobiales bacterium]